MAKKEKTKKHNNLEVQVQWVGTGSGWMTKGQGGKREVWDRGWDLLPPLLFAFVLSGLQHLLFPQTEEV